MYLAISLTDAAIWICSIIYMHLFELLLFVKWSLILYSWFSIRAYLIYELYVKYSNGDGCCFVNYCSIQRSRRGWHQEYSHERKQAHRHGGKRCNSTKSSICDRRNYVTSISSFSRATHLNQNNSIESIGWYNKYKYKTMKLMKISKSWPVGTLDAPRTHTTSNIDIGGSLIASLYRIRND